MPGTFLFTYFHIKVLKEVVHINKRIGLLPQLSLQCYRKPHKSFHTSQARFCHTKGALLYSEAFYLSPIHSMHFYYLYFSIKQMIPKLPEPGRRCFILADRLKRMEERRVMVERWVEKGRLVGL